MAIDGVEARRLAPDLQLELEAVRRPAGQSVRSRTDFLVTAAAKTTAGRRGGAGPGP
jgi:hypothetical protein